MKYGKWVIGFIIVWAGIKTIQFVRNNSELSEVSNNETAQIQIDNTDSLRKAVSGSWKGSLSRVQIAQNQLIPTSGQITTSKPIKTAEKTDKKKKKKKKTAKKQNKQFQIQVVNNRPQRQNNPEQPATPSLIYPLGTAGTNQEENKIPKTVEEWYLKIASPPNKEQLNNLILSFQSGLIDAELFYAVIDKLLEDSSDTVRQFGVNALAANPGSVSFEKTVLFIERESTSTLAGQTANDLILSYKKIEMIGILNQQLLSEVAIVRIKALTLIRDSALELISKKSETPSPSPLPAPPNPDLNISGREYQVFNQTLGILSELTGSAQSSLVTETIQVLQRLLS